MRNKRLFLLTALAACTISVTACSKENSTIETDATPIPTVTIENQDSNQETEQNTESAKDYTDGIYRGFFYDKGTEQVSVQFEIAEGKFLAVNFRGLNYKGDNYLDENASDIVKSIAEQYKETADYLVRKEVDAIPDLLNPGDFVSDKDAVTGATLRANKLSSAIYNGLNRGVYKLSATTHLADQINVPDGEYRGFYTDGNVEQVCVIFVVKDNKFESVKLKSLNYKEDNYLAEEANDLQKAIASQYQEAVTYLVGKEVASMNDLYTPEGIISDVDAVTGATLRSNKLISAINDGITRGIYKLPETSATPSLGKVEDGTYRGYYADQIGLEFSIKDGKYETIHFRTVAFNGMDYTDENAIGLQKDVMKQYQEAVDYLIGKEVDEVFVLYAPETVVSDTDTVTAATLRSSKFITSIVDGINRGVYK